ncbi:MAG: GGDEF domain-containing protein, partial [Mogibacterium sp.]|nr:GGDEF domain-containing protein [Mogibacterium sp.]
AGIQLTKAERGMSPAQLRKEAETLVFDNNYMHYKDRIRENVSLCTQSLIRSSSRELERSSARLSLLVKLQTWLSILFLLIVLGMVLVITSMIRKPLSDMVRLMRRQEIIPPTGAEELRFVTRTYNQILKENMEARERLRHEASHDALTGLFNRGAYDLMMESVDTKHMALILIDVDYFKEVNDTYGHAAGDRVLKKVADLLRCNFRSVDVLCRIGGDEFAVIMTRVNSSMRQLVLSKMNHVNEVLQKPDDDVPAVSLSVGIAFSDRENPQGDIFSDADRALYTVKRAGRKGCAVYGHENELPENAGSLKEDNRNGL